MNHPARPGRRQVATFLGALAVASSAWGQGGGPGLARKAQGVLRERCYECHGRDGSNEGGFNYATDLKKLVAGKKVVPGEPLRSKLYRRLTSRDNPMPPEDDDRVKTRPGREEIAVLEAWIRASAPDVEGETPKRAFLDETALLKAILDDLATIEERGRRYARYFTIAHLANAGLNDDQLLTYRHGLSKLINSLSWGRRIVVPRPVDAAGTVLRIDLRDLRWDAGVWRAILAEYPYKSARSDAIAGAVASGTGCDLPYVRADWFVFAASRPPLYHDVLRLPSTDLEMEERLGIDVEADIRQERVARAGFNGSGVSRNNRLIERHESGHGAYWKSYDFGGNVGRRNLFANPLGPGDGPNAFRHDGGEIIFSLPNGLQAYMLVRGDGRRIDKGPTEVVLDREQGDAAVVNGISCMRCHARGMIEKSDQVRAFVGQGGPFPRDVSESILALYPPQDAFDALLREDAERFAAALAATGARPGRTEPVSALARSYERDLDLPQAAAEAGLGVLAFSERLRRSPQLAMALGSLLVAGGTVQRDAFVEAFPLLVGEAATVRPRGIEGPRPVAGAPAAAPSGTVANALGMTFSTIPAGSFEMGSAEGEGEADEHPRHRVTIGRPFELGVLEVTQAEYEAVMGENPSYFSSKGPGSARVEGIDTRRFPVENVSWDDAVAFCNKLSEREGLRPYYRPGDGAPLGGDGYRLPTEAEWEYACRAGTTGPYHFGGAFVPTLANGQGAPALERPAPAGSYPPNAFGLRDLHGNVWEWCADRYEKDAYQDSGATDRTGPGPIPGASRVLRGGSWNMNPSDLRSATRFRFAPGTRFWDVGFRVARDRP